MMHNKVNWKNKGKKGKKGKIRKNKDQLEK